MTATRARATLVLLVLLPACAPTSASWSAENRAWKATELEVAPRSVVARVRGVDIDEGGYGSAVAVNERAGTYYLLTDRGPNVDGARTDEKLFLTPRYAPEIGVFRVRSGRLVRVGRVWLGDSKGRSLSGLPRPSGHGGTGEIARGPDGSRMAQDPIGLDPEGLVAMGDGSFWISDEYGPDLAHFDPGGRMRERIDPLSGSRRLPAVLARRRPNRGMEGLTYLERERTLVGIMQSPLDNPAPEARRSTMVRVVFVPLAGGACRQYLYRLDDPDAVVSDIAALSPTRFLVLEIDTDVPGDRTHPSKRKRIYAVDLTHATDVDDPADSPRGGLVSGRTIEQLSAAELGRAGIVVGSKRLVVDLLAPAIGYRHAKAEGLAVLHDGTIVVSNDNDFGITGDGRGGVIPKRDASGAVEGNSVYVIRPGRHEPGGRR